MAKLIDADKLTKKLKMWEHKTGIKTPEYVWDSINSASPIPIQAAARTGFWRVMNCLDGKARAFCSECNREGDGGDTCDYCGAVMVRKE